MAARKGLFGAPMAVDANGIPTYEKPSTGQMIAGIIGDAVSNWAGGQGTFLPGLQARQQAVAQYAVDQRQRAEKFADWQQQEQWKIDHPSSAPTEFQRNLLAAGIQPGTPDYIRLSRQKAENDAAGTPFVYDQYNPATGQTEKVIAPRSGFMAGGQQQAPMTTLPQGYTVRPKGGAASGQQGFRPRF